MNTITYQICNRIYINLTNRCSLVCQFCPKQKDNFSLREYDLKIKKQPKTINIITELDTYSDYDEVVFCGYGESTFRLRALLDIAEHEKNKGKKVRLNTDGLGNLIHNKNILPELARHIDALSISLNAHNEHLYELHCKPSIPHSYPALLAFITLAPRYINDVTATAIDGLEGVDIQACKKIADLAGVKFKARQLDILG